MVVERRQASRIERGERMSRVDEVLLEKIRHFAGAGMGAKAISAELGIDLARVYRLRRKVGLGADRHKPLPASVVQQIITAYERQSVHKIALALNLTHNRVYHVLKSNDIAPPFGRSGRPRLRKPQGKMNVATKVKILKRRDKFEQKIADEFGVSIYLVRNLLRRRRA
jgi:hypothetical protein